MLKEQFCTFSKQWFTTGLEYLVIITTVLLIALSLFSHIWLLQPHKRIADSKTEHLCRTTQLRAICPADPFRPAQVLLNTILEHVSFNIHRNRGGVMRCKLNLRMFCKQNYPFCESIIVEGSTWSPYSAAWCVGEGNDTAVLELLWKRKQSPSPDSYKNQLFTGKCAELPVLGTTIPDLPCSPMWT